MEDIIIKKETIQAMLVKAIPEYLFFEEELKNSYSSPIRKVIEKAIEDNLVQIHNLITELISSAINDPIFKEKLGAAVLNAIVMKGLKN